MNFDDDLFDDSPDDDALWNSAPLRTLRLTINDLIEENARLNQAVRWLAAANETPT